MKLSIIIGVIQMTMGIVLKLFNGLHYNKPYDIWFEFIPQMLFMTSIFGYMCLLIIIKWCTDWSNYTQEAPGLLNMMIDMFLTPFHVKEPLYSGQATVQNILVIIAFVAVPWMLLPKPLLLKRDWFAVHGLEKKTDPLAELDLELSDMQLDVEKKRREMIHQIEIARKGKQEQKYHDKKKKKKEAQRKGMVKGIGGEKGREEKKMLKKKEEEEEGGEEEEEEEEEYERKGDKGVGTSRGAGSSGSKKKADRGGDGKKNDRKSKGKEVGDSNKDGSGEEEDEEEDDEEDEDEDDDDEDEEEEFDFSEIFIHQVIHTIEFVLGAVSNTASYLRLWALSLAHAELSIVFWDRILATALISGNFFAIFVGFFCVGRYYVFCFIVDGISFCFFARFTSSLGGIPK